MSTAHAQREESTSEHDKTFREFDTYDYFKERRWSTVSDTRMGLNQNIDVIIKEVEDRIRGKNEEIKIPPTTI